MGLPHVIAGEESYVVSFQENIEEIGPEIDHHFFHLALAHDLTGELDERGAPPPRAHGRG